MAIDDEILADDAAPSLALHIAVRFQTIAAKEGLIWAPRYGRTFLSGGMQKRHVTSEKKYPSKLKVWWHGVAFQDEGHFDP